MTSLRVLDLFSGIGGFSLGLERTGGFKTVAFCEIEPYAQAVLAKHWPGVPIFSDVRLLNRQALEQASIGEVDVICGGFPCQDISDAGKHAGIEGERSGLWFEYSRLIDEFRPRWAIIENVAALRSRGLDAVLGSLAAIGYDAEWHCIPASAVGAPHRRDRIWIVAYPNGESKHDGPVDAEVGSPSQPVADADEHAGRQGWVGDAAQGEGRRDADRSGERSADQGRPVAHPHRPSLEIGIAGQQPAAVGGGWWLIEPNVGRVAHGVPARVDRLRALGNAVVPQIPELIGRAILEHVRKSS